MTRRLGRGLPSTLTPERIKDVLKFSTRHEREFKAELDRDDAPDWVRSDPGADFYNRIYGLLRTAAGREAYEKARRAFEGAKSKRSGRADFFRRLEDACLRETLGQDEYDVFQTGKPFAAVIEALARSNAWNRLAEFSWASAVRRARGDNDAKAGVDEALEAYPDIAPYLEEVQEGLAAVDGSEEDPNEDAVAEHIGRIKEIAAGLDPEYLDRATLNDLRSSADGLIAIAEARESRRRDTERLRSRLQGWREDRSETLAAEPKLNAILTKLEARIDDGDIVVADLEAALGRCEKVLDAATRGQETRAAYEQAVKDDDLDSVSILAADLASLNKQRDEAYAAIDHTDLSESTQTRALKTRDARSAEREAPAPPSVESGDNIAKDAGSMDPEPAAGYEPENAVGSPAVEAPETIADERSVSRCGKIDRGQGEQDEAPTKEPPMPEDPGEVNGRAAMPDNSSRAAAARIEREIERGRLALAYHLALSTPEALPSANAIKLITCNHVADERMLIAHDHDLSDLADKLLDEAEYTLNEGPDQEAPLDYTVLLTSAALTPALVSPGRSIASLLSFLESRLADTPSLQALAKATAEWSNKRIPPSVALFREDDPLKTWSERMSELRDEMGRWRKSALQTTIRFQAATRVWRRLLAVWETGGRASIGRMVELLVNEPDDRIDIETVSAIATYWRNNGDREIDRVDRSLRSSALVKKIDGPARRDLLSKITEVLDLVGQWCKVIEARPDTTPAFSEQQADSLRDSVRKNAESALGEIQALSTPMAREAGKLVRRYASVFESDAIDTTNPSLSLSDLLHGDLLANPEVGFDETGHPSCIPVDDGLLQDLANSDRLDLGSAATERAKRGDFHGADAALDFAQRSGRLSENDLDGARSAVDEWRECFRQKLEIGIRTTGDYLDAAYARGVLPRETFEELRGLMPATDSYDVHEFSKHSEELSYIEGQIDLAQTKEGERLRRSLAELDGTSLVDAADKRRVEDAIEGLRFQIAQDYVDRLGKGEQLPVPEATAQRPFDQFFPDFVNKYVEFRDETPDVFANVQQAFKDRTRAGPIDAGPLSSDAADDGHRLLEAWFALRTNRSARDTASALLNALGLTNVNVGKGGRTDERVATFILEASPVADRRICQLPDFGSRAGGRYRLVVIREYRTAEAILREAGEKGVEGTPPNIVLFLNVLDADERRALAHGFNSGTYHPTIVLDEALATFLATWSGDRLGAFFDCASAFAFAQPFDPDAAEVPPELFVGRKSERNKILAISGAGGMSHLVYGGRRLGKTALLADIAREYRTRAPDWLVSVLNLRGKGIGENRPVEDLWMLLSEKLAEHNVEDKIIEPGTSRHESIEKGVKRWLGSLEDRRILLMVDEADAFLEADGRQKYRVLEQIKRVMDETKRKFKVVFAGLHNVQRTARDPNTPFAHLGEPIGIGPMLPETDGSEIESLIRGPLEALGYRFASTDSVIRIAAETNYYPALVQQFCKELLWNLRDNDDGDAASGPPYTIPMETVDRVFDSRETRDRIRSLFSWTIQLDSRYDFLTYLIARQSFYNGRTRLRGLSIADIRQAAINEWFIGFDSDSSFGMFEALLEEMVGLGILRETADKEYAIRTRNLRILLGNDKEVERRFQDAKRKEPPPTFDPTRFRNTLKDRTPSSLTAGQERHVFSRQKTVVLVFGTRLGGLDRVHESLAQAAERLPRAAERGPAVRWHEDSPSRRQEVLRSRLAGLDIVLADARGTWDPERIDQALTFVSRSDARTRTIRLVFLCGPGEAWAWLNEERPHPKHGDVTLQDIWLAPCARDFTRTWLREQEALAYDDLENRGRRGDLLWPAVAGAAAGERRPTSIEHAIDLALDGRNLVSDVLATPEARTALRVFSKFPGDPMDADLLAGLSQDMGEEMASEEAHRVVVWGDRLGILHSVPDESGRYRLDATYAKGLEAAFGE